MVQALHCYGYYLSFRMALRSTHVGGLRNMIDVGIAGLVFMILVVLFVAYRFAPRK
jgi:hypothetical protein